MTVKETAVLFLASIAIAIGVGLVSNSRGKASVVPLSLPSVSSESLVAETIPSVRTEVVPTSSVPSGMAIKLAAAVECLNGSSCADVSEISVIHILSDIKTMGKDVVEQVYRLAEISAPLGIAAIDIVNRIGTDQQLEKFFKLKLKANAKAHLVDAGLSRSESDLPAKAVELVESMIREGSAAEVLAALPKASHLPEETVDQIAAMQSTLCRFQSSKEDQLGFEMIKVKFNSLVKDEAKSWQSICKG